MSKITIISKESHQVLQSLDTLTAPKFNLTENSAIIIDIPKEDVAKITREGNSAIITLRNGETIVIENYFNNDNTADNSVAFVDDSGKMYWAEFTDAKGVVTDTIKYHLIDDVEPLLYNDDHFAGLLLPWLGGAAAVGGIAAAASNNDDDHHNNNTDKTPPSKPEINPINPKDPITGKGDEGSTIVVTYPDGHTVTTTVKPDGTWEVPNPGDLKDGDEVKVIAKDPSGNPSEEEKEIVDGIAPVTPHIDPINPKDPITGTGEEGSTVVVEYPNGNTVTTTVKPDGTWEVPNPGDLKDGDEVKATAKDPAGNVSGEDTEIVDGIAPNAPSIDPVGPNLANITGTAEPNTTVKVTFPDGSSATAPVAADGTWSVPTPAGLKDGDTITAISTDAAGNPSAPATATVDGVGPVTDIDPINATAPITGTGEPNSTVKVTFPDGSSATTTVAADGTWSVANPGLKDGDQVKAVGTDKVGNIGPESTETVDGVVPNAPSIDPVGPNLANITGTAEPNTTVKVTFPDGSSATATVAADGTWSVATPAGLKDGDTITAISTDAAGNPSAPATATVDGIGPVTDIDPINATAPITGTGEPNSTVKVTFPDGSSATTTVTADGTWSVANPGLKDGDQVKAVGTDKVGNIGPESTETVDGVVPNAPSIDEVIKGATEITGHSDVGTTVTVTFNDGSTVTALTQADGTWSVSNPGVVDGDVIKAYATDPAHNQSSTTTLTVHFVTEALLDAPTAYDDVGTITGDIKEQGVTNDDKPDFSGKGAIVGSIIKVYADDVVIGSTTVKSDGTWTVTPDTALNNASYQFSATQTERGVESDKSPLLGFTVDTIIPVVQSGDINNAGTQVTGQTEAGALVEIRDGTGQLLGTSTADVNGLYSVNLTPAVTNGAAVQVTAIDLAGNSSLPLAVSDQTGPVGLTLDALFDNVANDNIAGAYNTNFMQPQYSSTQDNGDVTYHTNDTTPTLIGRGEPGASVSIYDGYDIVNGEKEGDTLLGTAIVDAAGNWQFTMPETTDGWYRMIYRQTDTAGNHGPWGDDLIINIATYNHSDYFSALTDTFGMQTASFALGAGPDSGTFLVNKSTIRYYGQNGVVNPDNSIHVVNSKGEVVDGVTWTGKLVDNDYMVTMQLPSGYVGGYSIIIPKNSYSDYAGNNNLDYKFNNPTMKPDYLITDSQFGTAGPNLLIPNGRVTNDTTPTWELSAGQPSTTKVLIRSTDGTYYQEVDIIDRKFQFTMDTVLSEGQHSYEFSYIYKNSLTAKEVQSPWSEPFTFTVDSKAYLIKSGYDNVSFDHAIYDKAMYNLLVANDPTGGNKVTQIDEWSNFQVSPDDAVKDTLDLSKLLNLKDVTDANVKEFLSVTYREGDSGKHTVISIDRDGTDTKFSTTELIVLKNVDTTLDQLLQNHQIIY